MGFRKIKKLFKNNSVCVVGAKGKGKDVLMGNVIASRRLPYVSNTYFGKGHIPLDINVLRVGGNRYTDFINDTVKPYFYPYKDNTDIYIADVGVYFPSQYCNELNRDFKEVPVFMALSRHLGEARVHTNCQAFMRCWDKIREMSDCFLLCEWLCKPLLKIGIYLATVIEYDREESCKQKIKPFKLNLPLMASREMQLQCDIQKQQFINAHGKVKRHLIFKFNRSKHNTRVFKTLVEGGKNSEM